MEIQPLDHMRELMHTQGLRTQLLVSPYADIHMFDEMLRHLLYKDFDYGEVTRRLEDFCQENTVYFVTDHFETHYTVLRLPFAMYEQNAFFVIGPYLSRDYNRLLDEMVDNGVIPLYQRNELREFYCGIPHIPNTDQLSSMLIILARYVFSGDGFMVERMEMRLDSPENGPEIKREADSALSMALIEERYRNEDALLDAIEQGNVKKAMIHLSSFQRHHIEPRQADPLRNLKNFLIILNTHFRKAVQRADVHPAHIHNMSDAFARRIEAQRGTDELSKLVGEMIHKYCLLVQNHSLKGRAKPIQNALNYIDFHYTEPINLGLLSEVSKVSASYLSTQFKKEMGLSVVDYVNQQRVKQARVLLTTTNLPVNKVSELVGFLDENYFTRMFKRYAGQSPREYRRMVK